MLTARYLKSRLQARPRQARVRGDRGEGVISAAIAVLVMAFLGVAMWVGLHSIWQKAETNTGNQVEQIGH
jgi:hypothetical protein